MKEKLTILLKTCHEYYDTLQIRNRRNYGEKLITL